jgi:hypothetical protein
MIGIRVLPGHAAARPDLLINAGTRGWRSGWHPHSGVGAGKNAVFGLAHGLVLGPKIESK